MDVDTLEKRVARLERFWDKHAPGWRQFADGVSDRPQREENPLVVDEEQTKRDRIAIGLDEDPENPRSRRVTAEEVDGADMGDDDFGDGDDDTARRNALMAELAAFKDDERMPKNLDELDTDKLEHLLAEAKETHRAENGYIDPVAGAGPGDPNAPNTKPPAEAVAVGAANASPETQAALETQNDPARAARAAEQRAARPAPHGG